MPHRDGRAHCVFRRAVGITCHAARQFVLHEGFELSGYTAFTGLLSLFPFLLFLTALAGFIGDANVADRVLTGAFDMSPREVGDVLRPIIASILTQHHGGLLTIGILFALWSASSGLEALRTILNRSYGLVETRPIWMLRPQSIVIVIFGTMLAMLASGIIIFGPFLLGFVRWLLVIQRLSDATWAVLRYSLAGGLVTGALTGLHLTLPNARLSLRDVWPGAVLTTLLWLAAAGLFSIYISNFSNFSITYGSLGGIILTLLFFYMTAILFAYGAEVNAALQQSGPIDPPAAMTARDVAP